MMGTEGSVPPEDSDVMVLLEKIHSEVRVVAEGHGVLLQEIRETRADLQRGMDTGFADLRLGIREIVGRLDTHERAHAS